MRLLNTERVFEYRVEEEKAKGVEEAGSKMDSS
jgi:hypothetical protein